MKVIIILLMVYAISLFQPHPHSNLLSQFVSLNGTDEYVISELKSRENIHRVFVKSIPYTDFPYGKIEADISLMADFKYYIKLAELKYVVENGSLVFTVPKLYLSTPVAFDSSTLRRTCDSQWLVSCKDTLNTLMTEVSSHLEKQGELEMTAVYDKSAKALADAFDGFVRNTGETVFYDSIQVVFTDEPGTTRRMFTHHRAPSIIPLG